MKSVGRPANWGPFTVLRDRPRMVVRHKRRETPRAMPKRHNLHNPSDAFVIQDAAARGESKTAMPDPRPTREIEKALDGILGYFEFLVRGRGRRVS